MPLTFLLDGRMLIQVVDSLDFERVGIGEIGCPSLRAVRRVGGTGSLLQARPAVVTFL